MKKIIVIGCGFGGISCCKKLSALGKDSDIEITAIDSRKEMDFLPCLPDIIGRNLSASSLRYNIGSFLKKAGCGFINEQATALDLEKRVVTVGDRTLSYDYLVVSSGSETNFYGNGTVEKYAYKLDCTDDALKIKSAVKAGKFDSYLISGGGYTGVEIATNLRLCLNKISRKNRIIIVERGPKILGVLPEWMREYALDNLKRLNIEVITNDFIDKIEGNSVRLSGGAVLDSAMLIWAAGVRCADFMQKLNLKKNPQGRLEVDDYLRFGENSFAIGDAALVKSGAGLLRMAVMFAIAQGKCAAENIMRSINNESLRAYKPNDLGYIIPMANNRSCGIVLGVNLKGKLPTLLHYQMCIYRSYGLKNRWGMLKDLITGGKND